MKKLSGVILFFVVYLLIPNTGAREIALTFDDAPIPDSALMTGTVRTDKIIKALQYASVNDALFFVKADYIDEKGKTRLQKYTKAGFHLANHSYTHRSANEIPVNDYALDVYRAHLLLKQFDNVLPYHRFPFLHHGADALSIAQLKDLLTELGYQDGYVTVDNFDWYINALLVKAAENNQKINYDKARKLYVETLYQAIEFYDAIAQKTLKRSPKHLLLLHENDAAALFVGDLVTHLRKKGWTIISPQEAYTDPIAQHFPKVLFHKQGRVAAIANSMGVPESELRHPAENVEYLDVLFKQQKVISD